MKNLILLAIILFSTNPILASDNLSHDNIRKCYEDVLENKSEDDLLTLIDIPNPEDFFNGCGKLDKTIIKEMFTELYNMQKMTTPMREDEDIRQFQKAMIEGAQLLRIDFYPEDAIELKKWRPFSDAIFAVSSELKDRNFRDESEFSDNYLNKLFAIENKFVDLNDADLAHYTFEYVSMMSKEKCRKDCESAFNLLSKYFVNRPKAKQILLEQAKSYQFLLSNLKNSITNAEKTFLSLQTKQIKSTPTVRNKIEPLLSDNKLNSGIVFSDPQTICKKIKLFVNNCETSALILSSINVLDLQADELRKENDKCQNMTTVKTVHSLKRLSKKKNDILKSVNLIVQVFSQQTGYVFNENWTIKNILELQNTCKLK